MHVDGGYRQEPIDFQQRHFQNGRFGISVSNFMCISFVAIGRSLTIVSYVAFKMAAL